MINTTQNKVFSQHCEVIGSECPNLSGKHNSQTKMLLQLTYR